MFLYILIFILTFIYVFGTRNFSYWRKRNVKHTKPIPLFGNSIRQFMQLISVSDMYSELYRKFPNERYVGFYETNNMCLILRDPELIKQILVTDFQNFHSRGVNPNKHVIEPMLKNLFTVDGDLWKLLRQRLTPAFSTGKLKAMFPLIVERAEKLKKIAHTASDDGIEVDVRELMARYTTDFIGACGFGIDVDSLNDNTSTFRALGKRIFTVTKREAFVAILKIAASDLFKHLTFFAPEIERDTVSLVKQIMEKRNYSPSGRKDFIDLLLELKQKGKIVGESIEKINPDGTPQTVEVELDDLLMAAQVFVFFAAGFETSSSATSFMLHQLAFHPDAQKRCQSEVDEVLGQYGGILCYEAIKEMKYLEMAFKESIRLYPSPGFLFRKSVKPYTFPGTDLTIDEDVSIIIPIQGLHNDEKYFENPEEYRPDRFHPDNINNIKKFTFLPFGDGPRACIGERLGLMQSLAGVAALLSEFSMAPSKNTKRHPITDPTSTIVQSIKGGLPLSLIARNKDN